MPFRFPERLGGPVMHLGLAAVLLLASSPARADRIFRWTDEDGVLHVTNVPDEAKPGAHSFQMGGRTKAAPKSSAVPAPGSGRRSRWVADPTFQYRVGPDAPLDFVPHENSKQYDAHIQEACGRYNIPPALVRAVMNAESNFNPRAMSDKGAMGLMQLMPETGDDMRVGDILDPRENILGGVRYLRVLTNLFDGDMVRIVAAYNAGPRAVLTAGGVPQIPETQDYVRKVLKLYFRYKSAPQP